jgi:hypothetical protein
MGQVNGFLKVHAFYITSFIPTQNKTKIPFSQVLTTKK